MLIGVWPSQRNIPSSKWLKFSAEPISNPKKPKKGRILQETKIGSCHFFFQFYLFGKDSFIPTHSGCFMT
jgi:hypothetical protein